jgi:NAD+ kinase
MQIKTAGMVVDEKNPRSPYIASDIINDLLSNNIDVVVYPPTKFTDNNVRLVDSIQDVTGDIVFSVGGDGTILRTFLFLKDKDTPVMGIGLGEKNFLSSVTWENYKIGVQRILDGKVYIKQEMRLDVEIEGYNKLSLPPILNDAVLATATLGKTIYAYVALLEDEGEIDLWSGKCDGVIISTPIGSTAYSYAAGGPVIDTDLESIVVTPLLPVDRKPIIVMKPERKLVIWASRKRNKPILVLDGQIKIGLDWEDKVVIKKSENYANFVVIDKRMSISRMVKASR